MKLTVTCFTFRIYSLASRQILQNLGVGQVLFVISTECTVSMFDSVREERTLQ